MDQQEVVRLLADDAFTATFKHFMLLLDARIDRLRLRNDTADPPEVSKNQGAIQELIAIKNLFTKARKHTDTYDGAFG